MRAAILILLAASLAVAKPMVMADEKPWWEAGDDLEQRLFGALARGDTGAFNALFVGGDATAAERSFEAARKWLQHRGVDLAATRLVTSGPNGFDETFWTVEHAKGRVTLSCTLASGVPTVEGAGAQRRVAGYLRIWDDAESVRVQMVPGGGTTGWHSFHRFTAAGRGAGTLSIETLERGHDGPRALCGLPVGAGNWKVQVDLVECSRPGTGPPGDTALIEVTLSDERGPAAAARFEPASTPHATRTETKVVAGGQSEPGGHVAIFRRTWEEMREKAPFHGISIRVRFEPAEKQEK